MKFFGTLALLLATLVAVSGAAVAADTRDQKFADEMSALVEAGSTIKDAATTLCEIYKDDILKDESAIADIFNAINVAANKFNIETNESSAAYSEAVAAASGIMINQYGISDTTVLNSAIGAGVDIATLISTLPATAAGPETTAQQAQASAITKANTATGIISSSPGGSGGGAASPAS